MTLSSKRTNKEFFVGKLNETFTTLSDEAHVEFEEKRSIFIGHAKRTDSEQEAQDYIKKIKRFEGVSF